MSSIGRPSTSFTARATRYQRFPRREIECLRRTALGKDYKDIAVILGDFRYRLALHENHARFRLGCATAFPRPPRGPLQRHHQP